MATDKKPTDYIAPSGGVAGGDKLYLIDVSDTSENAAGSGAIDTVSNVLAGGGAYVSGGTDVPVTDGGTGASSASDARSNLGLGNVDNTSDANKPVSTAQAAAIGVVQSDIDAHEADTANPHAVTKTQVGLGSVTNNAQYYPGGTDVAIADGGTGASTKAAAFDALSPMTSSGDIVYGGASGTGTRLAKGSDGQVLTLASGVPSWAAAGGGSSGVRLKLDLYAGLPDNTPTFPLNSHIQMASSGTAASTGINSPKGLSISTGTTNTGFSHLYYHLGGTSSTMNSVFDQSPRGFFHMATLGDNGDHKWFMGIGAGYTTPTDDGATRKIVGFRMVRDAAASVIYAVVGSGSAETVTNVTSSLDGFSAGDFNKASLFWFDMTSGTSVKFYHNLTLLTTITTNLPSGAPTTNTMGFGAYISNNSDGTASNVIYFKQAYYEVALT